MSSSIADTKSALERCLELLKPGTSDESKFIGLTLMSDVLQSTQDLDTMTRFFESMDFGFLDRMMQIEDGSVPKDAGVDAAAIRSISIDIMTCFSIHWEVLVRKEFKDRVPTMVGMLSASDETDNSKKILKILVRISAYPQVSMVLTNAKYQSVIVSYILDTFDRKDEAHEDAILIYKRTFLIIQEGYKQNPSVVLNITKDFLPTVMTKFSKPFSTLAETHKPEILRLLAESIAYLSEAYVQQHAKEHPAVTLAWSRNLKSGLIQLLSTRQGSKTSSQKKKSTPGTLLASMQTLSLSDVETEKKFAALVVHLTCVEVRVLMDQLADGLSSAGGKSNSVFETEDEAKQATVRKEQILPLTYEILEVSIGYLVRVSESEDSLEKGLFDATGVLKIQESLQGAFAAILDYLKDLQASSDASPQALASNMIYLASMRILSVWLMEDDSLHAQAASLVPPLEAVIRYWYAWN
ncbi:hypothetical protein BGZ58_010499 [Dissophora ornata]|nr:hypothetical protein BGZ58_010499 [Dissophora ornata]